MISLLFKFFGDSKPLVEETKKAKAEISKEGGNLGKAFGEQFKGFVMGYIGAGAIAGAVKKLVGDAAKIEQGATKLGVSIEAFQELTKAAEAVGMTVEELQQAAPKIAKEFTALMDSVQKSGGILDKDTVERLNDAAHEMNSFTGPLSTILSWFVKALSIARSLGQGSIQYQIGKMASIVGVTTMRPGMAKFGNELMSETVEDFREGGFNTYRTVNSDRGAAINFASAKRARDERIAMAMSKAEADEKLAKSIIGGENASGMFKNTDDAKRFIEKLDEIKNAIKEN